MKNPDRRFAVPLLLAVVTIILAAGGFYFIQKNKTTTDTVGRADGGEILKIPELGVEISVSPQFSGLTYTVLNLSDDKSDKTVGLSIKHSETYGDCADATAPFGFLTYSGEYDKTVSVGNIDNSELYYVRPKGQCGIDDPTLQEQVIKMLKTASPYHTDSDWKLYSDKATGISFSYPTDSLIHSSLFLGFTEPQIYITNSAENIDINGCYNKIVTGKGGDWNPSDDSRVTINGRNFCVSEGGDPGAGVSHMSAYYTTYKNNSYITIGYFYGLSNNHDQFNGDTKAHLDASSRLNESIANAVKTSLSSLNFVK